jgi:hypothetical protein
MSRDITNNTARNMTLVHVAVRIFPLSFSDPVGD